MKRAITGALLGLGWVCVLFLSGPFLFWSVMLLVGGLLLGEYMHISMEHHAKPIKIFGIVLGLLPIIASYCPTPASIAGGFFIALALLLALCIALLEGGLVHSPDDVFDVMLRIAFGAAYIGFFAAHVNLLKNLADGTQWLFFLSLVIAASDTGAYYVGKLAGKRKLCPSVSPGKTIEGLAGGVASAVVVALALKVFYFKELSVPSAFFLTIFLVLIGVAGDLAESLIKRAMKRKDSSGLLPGHGGFLDRLDSFILSAPALYYFLQLKRCW